jgi:S-DNA-T family DNA segregation ATPase FtsK/SpoIIIE
VQFYCLDFGGGSLASLAGLPHVGGIANRMQPERVSRTVAEVQDLMARRERMFTDLGLEGMPAFRAARAAGLVDDPYGDVFLCVDGWASLRADFEEQDQMIRQISGRGLNYGVHLVLTTSRWSEVNSGLRDQLGTKVELRLGEAIDSLIDIRAANTVPRQSGRGLTMDKLHYLATIPRIDGRSSTDDLTDAVRAMVEAVADNWTGPPAPPVRLLPSLLPAAELPPAQRSGPGGSLRLALGLAERDFQPVWHDFAANPHLTVIGDNASGKTAVLRLVVRTLIDSYTPDEVQLVVLDSRRALLEHVPQEYRAGTGYTGPLAAEVVNDLSEQLRARLPGAEITQQQLARRDWWTGPEYYIVVDDYDLLMGSRGSGPLDAIVDLVPVAGDIGLHIVLTRPAAGSSRLSMDSVIRRLQESNTPDLALSVPTNEMPLLNGMRPRPFPPGRGMVVTRRAATQLQIGWTEP